MSKHLKLTIKNAQIAEAVNLSGLKDKLAKKKAEAEPEIKAEKHELESESPAKAAASAKSTVKRAKTKEKEVEPAQPAASKEEAPRIRARTRSAFSGSTEQPASGHEEEVVEEFIEPIVAAEEVVTAEEQPVVPSFSATVAEETPPAPPSSPVVEQEVVRPAPPPAPAPAPAPIRSTRPVEPVRPEPVARPPVPERERLGPTGRHIKDLFPPKKPTPPPEAPAAKPAKPAVPVGGQHAPKESAATQESAPKTKGAAHPPAAGPVKEFRDMKPTKHRPEGGPGRFDARDRQGLRDTEEEQRWRKKRPSKMIRKEVDQTIRPTSLSVRLPITVKDLASEMKLKAAQLIAKLLMQGVVVTLNDLLDDETMVQLLGSEFGCDIAIDTSEAQRIQITGKSIKEEIQSSPASDLVIRPSVVAFMGHVDHGKTSLIDAIRRSNRVAGEAGAITQHIGAFRCSTAVGDITILDTPGHEAFSAMRARGAEVTDIVVLVVAGDEGIRQQTIEAIQHAKNAKVTIVIAINKSDKPGFNPENVYRQLTDHDLVPEAWGGQILTVNCSAVTGEGIKELLETLALQSEVLELKANPKMRARGTVLESEMHKGMGAVATVLVQNGTLKLGDALVFEGNWGRVRTMKDEFGKDLKEAGPSTPVAITGLSGLPEAGEVFIAVKNEREAREIAEARQQQGQRLAVVQKKPMTVEGLLAQTAPSTKKVLNLILRADVQGSLEALRTALEKIDSKKVDVNVIFSGVGEVSESDVELAATSKAVIIGFHTRIESHADMMTKQYSVQVRMHDIIYHAIDDVKAIMKDRLDKIAQETERGQIEVKALFKSSQVGTIAGCQVSDGTVIRSNLIRVMRGGKEIARSPISSLRRGKDDVREVSKGMECGIVLSKFSDLQAGDTLVAFEITYLTQEL